MARVSEFFWRWVDRLREWMETGPASLWVSVAVFIFFCIQRQAENILLTASGISFGAALRYLFGLHMPLVEVGFWWQPLTYALLHGAWWHLGVNLISLILVGYPLETWIGSRRFLLILAGSVIGGGLFWLLATAVEPALLASIPGCAKRAALLAKLQPEALCIGLSGGVMGMIGAYAAFFPAREVRVFLFGLLLRMRAARLLWLMTAMMLIEAVFFFRHVAYAAHFGGFWAGWLIAAWFRPKNGSRLLVHSKL